MPEVLTFGEVMGTVRIGGKAGVSHDVSLSIAGSEGNVAIGLARLGHDVGWVGCLGADAIGDLVIRTLAAERVAVGDVRRLPDAASGILVSQLSAYGGAKVDYHRHESAGSRIDANTVLAAISSDTKLLHVTGITPALGASAAHAVETAMRFARSQSITISLDVNYRSRLWDTATARHVLRPLGELADIVIGGEDEIRLLEPDAVDWRHGAEALAEAGCGHVVVKLGADGAASYCDGQWNHANAVPVPVRDPIGAGDAFVAGYLSALLEGTTTQERLARGNALGACAVASFGDWEGLPTRAELATFTGRPGYVVR